MTRPAARKLLPTGSMNRLGYCSLGFCLLVLPNPASGCEPIWPLMQLLSASTAAGPMHLTQSIYWLLGGITIKCIAFICFERRLSWTDAMFCMLLANLVSTVPGMLIAGLTSSVPIFGLIMVLPVMCLLARLIQKRVDRFPDPAPEKTFITGRNIVVGFIAFFIVSTILYVMAFAVYQGGNNAGYWVLKLVYVSLVAITGIIISAILEECVISELSPHKGCESFYRSVIRANYVTLAVILAVAAIKILPERMKSPDFMVPGGEPKYAGSDFK